MEITKVYRSKCGDIPDILWQVRRWNFVAGTAHGGKIDSAHFIASA
jgi:hypothetical protein